MFSSGRLLTGNNNDDDEGRGSQLRYAKRGYAAKNRSEDNGTASPPGDIVHRRVQREAHGKLLQRGTMPSH